MSDETAAAPDDLDYDVLQVTIGATSRNGGFRFQVNIPKVNPPPIWVNVTDQQCNVWQTVRPDNMKWINPFPGPPWGTSEEPTETPT